MKYARDPMSETRHPNDLERSMPPRLYVVPASPIEFDDGREPMLSAIRRRWRRALFGLVAGGAVGLATAWWMGDRLVYASTLELGRTVVIKDGLIEVEPVQDAVAAREAILERLRAAAAEGASALARGVELTPASSSPGERPRVLWMRLRTSQPLTAVEQAFGEVAAIAAKAQSAEYEAALDRQTFAIAVAAESAERATVILDRIRDGQAQSPVNLPDLIRLAGEANLLRDAAKAASPARIEGPILVAPQPAAAARAAATVALPAILLAFLASTPWRRRPAAR